MADGPRLIVGNVLDFNAHERFEDDEPDAITDLDPDMRRVFFYESKKALGYLFRAIDEKKFLQNIQTRGIGLQQHDATRASPISLVWEYIQRATLMIQWTHHLSTASTFYDE